MSFHEENKYELYLKLKNEMNTVEGKFIFLKNLLSSIEGVSHEMPAFLQSREGQTAFCDAVMKLVSDQLLIPVGKKPNTHNGLHVKYRINKNPEKKDNELISQIIKTIVLPATLDYYIKYPNDFLKDKGIIEAILRLLRQENKELVTVNERAYELFGDEKFFKGDDRNRSQGEIVLKRLGLSYSQIGCEETVEPFFSYHKKDFFLRPLRNIYIIENKDTFWSFKKNIMDAVSRLPMDMLIYGEGKKIISSFKWIDAYEVNWDRDTFFYFGDLDPEGINIYCGLKAKYWQYRILPFYEGYQAILEIGLKRELVKTPKQQIVSDEKIDRFSKEFDPSWALKIKKLLDGGFYIPQEALSATLIKERFGHTRHD